MSDVTGPSGPPSYAMAAVIRRTGLTADTLRVWERRHHVVSPERTGGNARRYSEGDVQRLLLLRDGVAQGRTIGELAQLPIEALRALAPSSPRSSESERLVDAYLAAVRELDAAASAVLLARAALLAPTALVFEVAVPILRAVGTGWAEGRTSIAEEHLASFQLRSAFAAALGARPRGGSGERVVFAAPEGHAHELGVLMAATLAIEHGVQPIVLGANTPVADCVLAAERSGARLIVLGVARAMSGAEQSALATALSRASRTVDVWMGQPDRAHPVWPVPVRALGSLEELDRALVARFGA